MERVNNMTENLGYILTISRKVFGAFPKALQEGLKT